MNNVKISISHGNKKMGEIPSVSLPPIVTCASGCTCARKCYAAKLCRIYKTVREAYARNLDAWENNPAEYFRQVEDVVSVSRFFRWHVSGDIPNAEYFREMVHMARRNPHCEMLVFTKRYDMINEWFWTHGAKPGALPKNLHVIFSAWDGMTMHNPYSLPVAHVIFKGEEPAANWNICPGNCLECARRGVNCWALGYGENVAFYEH